MLECLWIEGGRSLKGSVEVPAAKNAALPLLCLPLLTKEPVRFSNLPDVADIQSLKNLLQVLGVREVTSSVFQCASVESVVAPYDWVRRMRASILVLGPLLARAGEAQVSMPGGCAIGERPVDIHLKGLEALGAEIELESGYIKAKAKKLRGAKFVLDFPTVTGTINILTAACLAEGETKLENVAREPEISEVVRALCAMGAKIEGEGSSQLLVQGVSNLKGLESWEILPDRIQCITYLCAAAMTKGDIECRPYRPELFDAVIQKFRDMGCEVTEGLNSIRLKAVNRLTPVRIETAPFPGFPTDAQAQFMACLTLADPAKGTGVVQENIFESRFGHVSELRRMGASIEVNGNTAVIAGVERLSGASVMASDLRASAALVLAGLVAEGKTRVLRIYHLDRGYERLEEKLAALGAQIWRAPQ